jgi:hypothetical protein
MNRVLTLVRSYFAWVVLAIAMLPGHAFAVSTAVDNNVDLSTMVSAAASAFAEDLPLYILAGLGIFIALVLFRFGVRLLRRWVH